MKKVSGSKYEAPRAVRLSDAATASLSCLNGPTGTADVCTSGFAVQPNNVCASGSSVITF
jgi:hypothetical protein